MYLNRNIKNTVINLFCSIMLVLLAILLFDLKNISMSLLLLSVICMVHSKDITANCIVFLYIIILIFLLNHNIVKFDFIPQAEVLIENNPNILYWFSIGHPHAIRLVVAYPGYIISKIYNMSLDKGFSYYCILQYSLIYLFINEIVNKYSDNTVNKCKKNFFIRNIVGILPFFILPFIMNGRLISAFLGYSVIIYNFEDFDNNGFKMGKFIIFWIIGFIFTTVSSGTMTVAFIYSIFIFSYNLKKLNINFNIFKMNKIYIILLMLFLWKSLEYTWIMFIRNVTYFGGGSRGFFYMLNHGIGRYFMDNVLLLILMLFLIFAVISINDVCLKKFQTYNLWFAIVVSAYGLFFGFSTGLMIIPPLISILLIKL